MTGNPNGSRLIFRSKHQPWSVWGCACGCDEAVRLTAQQEADSLWDERYYVRHHGPLGVSPDRVGPKYDFLADTNEPKVFDYTESVERNRSPADAFSRSGSTIPSSDFKDEPTQPEWPIWSDLPDD